MTKITYLIWSNKTRSGEQLRTDLLDSLAPKILALDVDGLQLNIADDRVDTPSPAPSWPWLDQPFEAQLNLWVKSTDSRQAIEKLLQEFEFRYAGYRLDEWLYSDYGDNEHAAPRDWPDGQRSPGVLAVTLIQKPKRLDRQTWMQKWFGWQSPMSEWMQPRQRYVRNLIEETLTDGAHPYDGIVEEAWPSKEHVTNPKLFYGAGNGLELAKNMTTMLKSVTTMLPFFHITTVMMSEYFVKTPKA